MPRIAAFRRRLRPIGLAVSLGLLAGGCSSDRWSRPRPDRGYIVQRPAYDVDGTKNLYLGGYAGADYDFGARPGR
jgi:hypothetical protein